MWDDFLNEDFKIPPMPEVKIPERKEIFVTIGGPLADKVESVTVYFKGDKEE